MASIIIPAHNEDAVIGGVLSDILHKAGPDEFEVIVACNGCTDGTAERARRFSELIQVVEIDESSKTAALNAGDSLASRFPRLYLDADIGLSIETLREVVALLREGPALAAAPRLHVAVDQSTWPVRGFYEIWTRMPFHRQGMLGCGFYGLSEQGRARFERFPPIIADDEFVRAHFADQERANPADGTFTIRPPATLRGLIKVKTRSRLGLWQLRREHPELAHASEVKHGPKWGPILRQPTLWVDAAVYGLVNALTRIRAKAQFQRLETYQWERDDSSRISK